MGRSTLAVMLLHHVIISKLGCELEKIFSCSLWKKNIKFGVMLLVWQYLKVLVLKCPLSLSIFLL